MTQQPAAPAARRALFVSDVHLSENHPRTTEAFLEFLGRLGADRIDALYLLGDLFEYWAGDDDLLEPLNRRVVATLRAISAAGVALYLITGNRDLLLGSGFAHSAGVTILDDPAMIEVGGLSYLISHGDALCTDDHAYQAYRTMVRSAAWQMGFLSKPLVERKEVIESLREASETAKASKSMAIMDVNATAVAQLFRSTGATILIHGHTHRPGREDLCVDGLDRQRWVLPDWDAQIAPPRGGGLLATPEGLAWLGIAPTGAPTGLGAGSARHPDA